MSIENTPQGKSKKKLDIGDTTYRNLLQEKLFEEQITTIKMLELVKVMGGKSNEGKERIAKKLLEQIQTGEIRFADSDRYEIDEEDYNEYILPMLKLLRTLPDGSEVSTEFLLKKIGIDIEIYSGTRLNMIHHLLIYCDRREDNLLQKVEEKHDKNLFSYQQVYQITSRRVSEETART